MSVLDTSSLPHFNAADRALATPPYLKSFIMTCHAEMPVGPTSKSRAGSPISLEPTRIN